MSVVVAVAVIGDNPLVDFWAARGKTSRYIATAPTAAVVRCLVGPKVSAAGMQVALELLESFGLVLAVGTPLPPVPHEVLVVGAQPLSGFQVSLTRTRTLEDVVAVVEVQGVEWGRQMGRNRASPRFPTVQQAILAPYSLN